MKSARGWMARIAARSSAIADIGLHGRGILEPCRTYCFVSALHMITYQSSMSAHNVALIDETCRREACACRVARGSQRPWKLARPAV